MAAPRKALVLGASGMVGLPLCLELRARGWEVHGAARFGDPGKAQQLTSAGVTVHPYDLTRQDPARLPEVDVLFLQVWDRRHISAIGQMPEIFALNYDAVGKVVARYAGQAGIVNGSTISLYGARGDRPSVESDSPRPDTDYGLSRIAQELLMDFLCRQAGGRAVHLRYCRSNSATAGVVRHCAQQLLAGNSLGANPDECVQVIALEDFVRCTADAGERLEQMPPAVHVVHPRIWTVRELARRIARELQLPAEAVSFTRAQGGREASVWADATRMLECFGPPQVDLEQVIARACRSAQAALPSRPSPDLQV